MSSITEDSVLVKSQSRFESRFRDNVARRTERETQPPLQSLKDDNTGLKDKLSTLIETELSGYQSNPELLIWFMKPLKQITN